MPVSPQRRPARITRREVLSAVVGGCGALLLAGCTGSPSASSTGPGPVPSGSDDPDGPLRATVAAAERALAARYAAAVAARPTLATVLAVGARHDAYAAAVQAASPTPPGTTGTAAARPPKSMSDEQLLASLAAAEREAAADRVTQCGRAGDAELARILALAGAGAAAARAVLDGARG